MLYHHFKCIAFACHFYSLYKIIFEQNVINNCLSSLIIIIILPKKELAKQIRAGLFPHFRLQIWFNKEDSTSLLTKVR